MPRILITGGAGHIGGSLALSLSRHPDFEITVVDDFSRPRPDKGLATSPGLRFIRADVNDWQQLLPLLGQRFDWIFHYAAMVGVQRTLAAPLQVLRDLHGIENMLNLGQRCGARRFVFASSSEVYGESVDFPQREDSTPLNSSLPYAVVKKAGEAYVRAFQREFDLDYTILRMFNTYGPRQTDDFVIPRFIRRARHNHDLLIYGRGLQTRTFLHVDDHVDFVARLLQSEQGRNELFNVGSDQEVDILTLARLIVRLTGSRSRIIHGPELPVGDMARRLPDIERMRSVLGRDPMNLETGLVRMLGPEATPKSSPDLAS